MKYATGGFLWLFVYCMVSYEQSSRYLKEEMVFSYYEVLFMVMGIVLAGFIVAFLWKVYWVRDDWTEVSDDLLFNQLVGWINLYLFIERRLIECATANERNEFEHWLGYCAVRLHALAEILKRKGSIWSPWIEFDRMMKESLQRAQDYLSKQIEHCGFVSYPGTKRIFLKFRYHKRWGGH